MSGPIAEKDALVRHPIHGEGRISTLSPGGQYATVRYPAGYIRTHRLADLTPRRIARRSDMSRMRRLPTVLSVIEREALTFACPWCPAQPGAWCLTETGQPAPQMHASRIELGEST